MKRSVPLLIAAITGFVLIVAHFIPLTQNWGEKAMIWFDILAAVAFILGGGNLLKMNLRKVSDRKPGWGFAAVTIIAFLATLAVGLFKVGVHPLQDHPTYAWSGDYVQEGGAFWWAYNYVVYPLTSTMFAMLAFFVASAAFRAFRAKNLEAMFLLGTAFIVLLGRTYAGILFTGWLPYTDMLANDPAVWHQMAWWQQMLYGLRLDRLTEIIMNVFNLAGSRAITLGIALGVVSTSLKVLLGVDRSYLGSD
ncbi:MAG: hypothetical protein L0Y44_16705 [Phycisphaerales bacterium]|nr:hypothetical protein [Phycisphaerales bacterium]